MSEGEISRRLIVLSAKKAAEGLTDAEQAEAVQLRQELALIRAQKGVNR